MAGNLLHFFLEKRASLKSIHDFWDTLFFHHFIVFSIVFCAFFFLILLSLLYFHVIINCYGVLHVGVAAFCGFYIEVNGLHVAYAARL